jgi:hypothetical protein
MGNPGRSRQDPHDRVMLLTIITPSDGTADDLTLSRLDCAIADDANRRPAPHSKQELD